MCTFTRRLYDLQRVSVRNQDDGAVCMQLIQRQHGFSRACQHGADRLHPKHGMIGALCIMGPHVRVSLVGLKLELNRSRPRGQFRSKDHSVGCQKEGEEGDVKTEAQENATMVRHCECAPRRGRMERTPTRAGGLAAGVRFEKLNYTYTGMVQNVCVCQPSELATLLPRQTPFPAVECRW